MGRGSFPANLKAKARTYATALLNKAGLEIRRKHQESASTGLLNAEECTRFSSIVRPYTMVAPEGLVSLYEQALYCEEHEIPGAFVECGVWKGGAVGLMALVNLEHGRTRRHIHLFDSFQEICEPDEATDGERALREVREWAVSPGTKGRLVPLRGIYDHKGGPGSLDDNRRLLEGLIRYNPSYLHYHVGWFQDTLPASENEVGEIAILHLDADWYASTKICLDFLFDKVVKGGFVVIDDYGAYAGCRQAVSQFITERERPLYLNRVNEDIRYIIAN